MDQKDIRYANTFGTFLPFFRIFFNTMLLIIIPLFIFTIDLDGEESAIDLIKDFTALYILAEMDNQIKDTNSNLKEQISVNKSV